jgi:hypothetical protein
MNSEMTPLAIGFEKVSNETYHAWLKERCEQLHNQIKKDNKYGYRFFSGSHFAYIVKFHHNNTYDIYKMKRSENK